MRELYGADLARPYAVAENLSCDLALQGVTRGRQAIANKIIEAQQIRTRAERAAA